MSSNKLDLMSWLAPCMAASLVKCCSLAQKLHLKKSLAKNHVNNASSDLLYYAWRVEKSHFLFSLSWILWFETSPHLLSRMLPQCSAVELQEWFLHWNLKKPSTSMGREDNNFSFIPLTYLLLCPPSVIAARAVASWSLCSSWRTERVHKLFFCNDVYTKSTRVS